MYTKNMVFAQHNLTTVILSMLFLVISINYIIVIDREVLAQQNNVGEGKVENKNSIDFSAISVGILTGSVGISSAILTAYINKKGNIESQIRNDLRNKRISVYSEIFKLMLPLSVFSNNLKFYEQLEYLSENFTDWYYIKKGGLLMSRKSQLTYIDLLSTIECMLKKSKGDNTQIPKENIRYIKSMGFMFRLCLLKDVDIDVVRHLPLEEEKEELKNNVQKDYDRLFLSNEQSSNKEITIRKKFILLLRKIKRILIHGNLYD